MYNGTVNLMLTLELQSFGHLTCRADSPEKTLILGKTLMLGGIGGGRKGDARG